jgi:hypothetical protein
MRLRLGGHLLWAVTAVATGFIVLFGYFVQLDQIPQVGLFRTFFDSRLLLMRYAVLLAAVALFLGLFNLVSVHWNKVSDQQAGWPYSAILIVAFFLTLVLGLVFGPDSPVVLVLFNYVQLPVEASLSALLVVSLTLAGFRVISNRRDLISGIFIITALLVLIGSGPGLISSEGPAYSLIGGLRNWLAQVAAAGGARGVLLGVALGSIVTGMRILMAVDRPYGDR